jgi:ATP phosphoribosyltransferase
MLRVALPDKGALADPAAAMMREAGYRQRSDVRELSILDADNEVTFYYLRPKDIPTYVGSGHLHLGVTEHHLIQESGSPAHQVLPLGFGAATFGYATHERNDWKLDDLEGKTIATCHPWLVRTHLAAERLHAEVIKLDGAVQVAVHLGLADAIADVVCADTLARHRLVTIGEPIAQSQATLIEREPRADRPPAPKITPVFIERLRGGSMPAST